MVVGIAVRRKATTMRGQWPEYGAAEVRAEMDKGVSRLDGKGRRRDIRRHVASP
jgi:hypothetical protein